MTAVDSRSASRKIPRLLVLEFWGLGDLTFSTVLLESALERYEVTLLGKEHAKPLLEPTFPAVRFLAYDPPWTVFRGKYEVHKWDWRSLVRTLTALRRERFDAAVCVRRDPRDHLLMWLSGARQRHGFPRAGSRLLLTYGIKRANAPRHRAEDWLALAQALRLPVASPAPRLDHSRYRSERIDALFTRINGPVLCLHVGARIPTRRWPERFFAAVVQQLRREYHFQLLLVPDPDGYGAALTPLADIMLTGLSIPELVDLLGRSDLLLCNDSGPAHLAAACGRPVIPIFGPTDPDWYYPWGNKQHLIIRDICPWRPCFDYCRFSEPHCLTKLTPEFALPEIRRHIEHLLTRGILPVSWRKSTT